MIVHQLPSAIIFFGIVTLASGKPPPPPGAPWAKFVSKPVFERSLGPPPMSSGVSTFPIPYIPKPSMFPKFVDPRMMIAKKTDLLSNLFGGLGPAIGTPGFGSPSPSPYAGYGSSPYSYYPGVMYGPEESTSDSTSDDAGDNGNLPILYGSGFDAKTNYFDSTAGNLKRGLFGPMGSKSSFGGPFGPKSSMGGPFYGMSGSPDSAASAEGSPFFKRGLFGPKVMPFASPFSGLTEPGTPTTEKREYLDSISKNVDSSVTEPESKGATQAPLPPYPKTPGIAEEIGKEAKDSSLEKIFGPSVDAATSKTARDLTKRMVADDSIPTEYLPGMFGPMGPGFGPPGGIFVPGPFMSKKSMFLDTLFKNLATSTTPSSTAVTDVPVTEKSTIVPPGFWLPESVVPDPGAYNAKVGIFLDKLFDSLKLNASTAAGESPTQTLTYEESISAGFPAGKTAATRSLPMDYTGSGYSPYFNAGTKSVRSLSDPETVMTAKDQIVSSIIGELGILKNDMVATFDELIAYQKNLTTPSAPGGKPFKPFAPPFWSAASVTAGDIGTLPYKRRMLILDQVFDMLIELQTNVSSAVNQAVISGLAEETPEPEVPTTTVKPEIATLNVSVLDAIQAKLNDLNTIGLTKVGPKGSSKKFSRALTGAPSSFWVAYPGGDPARRDLNGNQENNRHGDQEDAVEETENGFGDFATGKDSRAIKMQMHQGYQSLPPGTIQSIQAGGGSVPGHEGGGVKLLGSQDYRAYPNWQEWSKAIKDEYENNNRRHHHGRH